MSTILKRFEGFTLWSEDYLKLAKWYEEKFELKRALEIDVPQDKAIAFEIDPSNDIYLWVGYHSEVHGKSKDTYRIMISYVVDDATKTYETLSDREVEFVAGPHLSPDGTLNVATAIDIDGNLIQLFSKV